MHVWEVRLSVGEDLGRKKWSGKNYNGVSPTSPPPLSLEPAWRRMSQALPPWSSEVARLPLNENKTVRCQLAKSWGLRPHSSPTTCAPTDVCSRESRVLQQPSHPHTRSSNSGSWRVQCWQGNEVTSWADLCCPNLSLSDTPPSSSI